MTDREYKEAMYRKLKKLAKFSVSQSTVITPGTYTARDIIDSIQACKEWQSNYDIATGKTYCGLHWMVLDAQNFIKRHPEPPEEMLIFPESSELFKFKIDKTFVTLTLKGAVSALAKFEKFHKIQVKDRLYFKLK